MDENISYASSKVGFLLSDREIGQKYRRVLESYPESLLLRRSFGQIPTPGVEIGGEQNDRRQREKDEI